MTPGSILRPHMDLIQGFLVAANQSELRVVEVLRQLYEITMELDGREGVATPALLRRLSAVLFELQTISNQRLRLQALLSSAHLSAAALI